MKIEILYPEICELYGDLMNAKYLARSCPEAELVTASLKEEPAFVGGEVALVCMGSTTERGQELSIQALRPYRDAIERRIEDGGAFLITGNAMELFGNYIENEDGSRVEGLGLFDCHAKRRMMARYNSLYLGKFGDMDIVGYKSQFSHLYGDPGEPLFRTLRGAGRTPGAEPEGLRRNNFMATYVLGPLTVLNPPFAKYLLQLIGARSDALAFEDAARDAYETRVKEFSDPNRGFEY